MKYKINNRQYGETDCYIYTVQYNNTSRYFESWSSTTRSPLQLSLKQARMIILTKKNIGINISKYQIIPII